MPGAFKLEHLQPVKLVPPKFFHLFFPFSYWGVQLLITPERGKQDLQDDIRKGFESMCCAVKKRGSVKLVPNHAIV